MMYQTLAHLYDALVKDDEATMSWVEFIKQHTQGKRFAELACGSGEITIALAKEGYIIEASDISSDMIEMAKLKPHSDQISWRVQDMRKPFFSTTMDAILCLCDSLNYVLVEEEIKEMFTYIYNGLSKDGIYIMDMHSLDRLKEFQDEFFEDGIIDGKGYQWTILTEEDYIYQNFAFYEKNGKAKLEQHVQRVYDPIKLKEWLEACGFHVEIFTDFDTLGIAPGEKYFYVCKKGH